MKDAKHRRIAVKGRPCRWSGGGREGPIRVIVIHDAEGANARGVENYGATTDRKVSWHVVCDDTIAIEQLPDWIVAWAAPGANSDGLQIELCGFASWSKATWFRHQSTLKFAAWQCARWARRHQIPLRWLTDAELAAGSTKGFATHAQVSRVFRLSTHTDPGKGFPLSYFMLLVRRRAGWLRERR